LGNGPVALRLKPVHAKNTYPMSMAEKLGVLRGDDANMVERGLVGKPAGTSRILERGGGNLRTSSRGRLALQLKEIWPWCAKTGAKLKEVGFAGHWGRKEERGGRKGN